MVFEGAMIVLATATLTLFHPGRAFGARWPDAGWSWSNANKSTEGVCETGSEKSIREVELEDVNGVAAKGRQLTRTGEWAVSWGLGGLVPRTRMGVSRHYLMGCSSLQGGDGKPV